MLALVLPLVLLVLPPSRPAAAFDWSYETALLSSIEERHRMDISVDIPGLMPRTAPRLEDLQYSSRSRGLSQAAPEGQQPGAEGRSSTASDLRRNIRRRCRVTRGSWCGQYQRQPGVDFIPTARGNSSCPNNCTQVGNCNYDTGLCDCPAGWTGEDCGTILLRPCTNRYRSTGDVAMSHVDANGRDIDWTSPGWMASRCPGVCDTTIAACFCDGPKFGHIPAPLGSAPGTPAIKAGRMLGDHCFAKQTPEGERVDWGNVNYTDLYGPKGWCTAEEPTRGCGCYLDGFFGHSCDRRHEMYCPNQCSGRGDCWLGFCKCHEGWYGLDCARKRAGAEVEASTAPNTQPWLRHILDLSPEAAPEAQGRAPSTGPDPAAASAAGQAVQALQRKRPLIYVYDLPAKYTTRMLQYRIWGDACVYRYWSDGNKVVQQKHNLYGLESYMYEAMLQSEHRTFDPSAADFFYVPTFTNCFIHPVFAWADHPWFPGPIQIRPMQAANMLLEVKRYIQSTYPFWNKTQGRDHIWLALHDEGACWFPTEVYQHSIILTHWGRMDPAHTSNTAFAWDNYTQVETHPEYSPGDWRAIYQGHACYSPAKDLVIPAFKWAEHYGKSPYMGGAAPKRDILLYFKGDVGTTRLKQYSRYIRQKLYLLSKEQDWRTKYNIRIGFPHDLEEGYSQWLAASIFCLVAPGDGWSSRAEDAILHGCIPLVIMDDVHAVYESVLDWDSFSVRIRESALEQVPGILQAIPEDRIQRMQRKMAQVWHRFVYTRVKPVRAAFLQQREKRVQGLAAAPSAAARKLHHAGGQGQASAAAYPLHGVLSAESGRVGAVSDEQQVEEEDEEEEEENEEAAEGEEGGGRLLLQGSSSARGAAMQLPDEVLMEDDAFGTIMQWLYSKIPETRGQAPAAAGEE